MPAFSERKALAPKKSTIKDFIELPSEEERIDDKHSPICNARGRSSSHCSLIVDLKSAH